MFILTGNISNLSIEVAQYLNSHNLLGALIIQKPETKSWIINIKLNLSRAYHSIKGRSETPWEIFAKSIKLKRLVKNFNGAIIETSNINNCLEIKSFLKLTSAKYILVIGGRIISKDTLETFKGVWINVHTGILPAYRGLESEYWAIKFKDFENIGVTLHWVNEKVDAGDVIAVSRITVNNMNESLTSVKRRNQENAIRATQEFVESLMTNSKIQESLNFSSQESLQARYFSSPDISLNFRRKIKRFIK